MVTDETAANSEAQSKKAAKKQAAKAEKAAKVIYFIEIRQNTF